MGGAACASAQRQRGTRHAGDLGVVAAAVRRASDGVGERGARRCAAVERLGDER